MFILLLSISFRLQGQHLKNRYAQFLGYKLSDNKSKVIIPFENFNNLIVIPVILNGTIPLKFILDTGVRTAILVDKSISDVLNLPYSRTITLVGASGGQGIAAHVAPNISLSLPGVQGAGQALLVLDEDYLKLGETLGTDVHGIIGYEIFSRFIVEINYGQKTLTLYEPAAFRKKRKYSEIPIQVEDTKPYVRAHLVLNEKSTIDAKLLVDTGASHSLLLHPDSHEQIVLPQKTIKTSLGKGLEGDIKGDIGRIFEINFAGFKVHNLLTSFPEITAYSEIISNTERHGSIGGGLLNRFDIVFDYFNQRILVKKNSDFKRKSNYNMSGIEVKASGNDYKKIVVGEVLKDSPAEASGIKVGDEIIMVNGIAKEGLSLNFINNLFKSKLNKKISMKINRDGEILKKNFKLKKII